MPSLPATPDCHGPTSMTRARSRCSKRCAPRLAGPRRRRPAARIGCAGRSTSCLPVPGDVRGLAAGTQFERDALAAGEAVIITNPDDPGAAVGLVPEVSYSDLEEADAATDGEPNPPELCALSWMVYSLPGAPAFEHHELGDAEYTLRSAVRSAADALGTIGLGSADIRHRRSAGTRRTTAGIHTATPDSRPRAVARSAGAGERRARRRDHRGQRGAESIARTRPGRAIIVGSPNRQQCAAAAQRGGALGADGRGQRDPELGLARLAHFGLAAFWRSAMRRTARRAVDCWRGSPAPDRGRSLATAASRSAVRRSDLLPAGRIADRRWAWRLVRTPCPRPRLARVTRGRDPTPLRCGRRQTRWDRR